MPVTLIEGIIGGPEKLLERLFAPSGPIRAVAPVADVMVAHDVV